MKIDVFSHILPEKYLKQYSQKHKEVLKSTEARTPPVFDLNVRLRLMNRYPDVLQVLSLAQPAVEKFADPDEAVELARTANEELAELVSKYPDKFIAAVACLPMNNIDAALEEADRAIVKLGLKGVQIYSRINGEPLDNPKFKPLFEKMVKYDLPIWIHPCPYEKMDPFGSGIFGWPFETASAMLRLVVAGTFHDYPDIKFITHHCGSMVPYFEQRLRWAIPHIFGANFPYPNPEEHFRRFYNDTAVYGSTPALMCAYAFFGAEHLLLGTDAPLGGSNFGLTRETIASVERMNITDAEKEKILLQNALDLLRLST